jgi:hypothetical protein
VRQWISNHLVYQKASLQKTDQLYNARISLTTLEPTNCPKYHKKRETDHYVFPDENIQQYL